ncbi:cell division protein ZapA [Umboniibacter marinipuniceus]|uniref:Cell division protein ZapA n=1 Tax=Umboniibacter marinipuniceus TaxID=569599 RepID=A0A3M0ACP1_9GAMM|nr:cell division protein ZapA [Umboniibacter marinipuniceus]RMA80225.1 cell division protein ZapA (FtsZ GTPase activity inhibitor) [Umboniibacter marinipuniceus]
MASSNTIELTFLEREYEFNCPNEQREMLARAADKLNQRMTEIHENTTASRESVILMAALNLSFELEAQSQSQLAQPHVDHSPSSTASSTASTNTELDQAALVEIAERLHSLSSMIGDID